ncbi:Copia protein, partial [Mucuna pruriens]
MKTYHLEQQILGNVEDRVKTRSTFKGQARAALLSEVEPKNVDDSFLDDRWIKFQKNDIWKLVSPPKEKFIIGKKWIFRNKLDQNGKVVRNKTMLVAEDYSQQKKIYFTKTFALVARLEVIHILLSFVAHYKMRLHQMDVKCAFLNDIINKKVFVKQPPGFESDAFPNHFLN